MAIKLWKQERKTEEGFSHFQEQLQFFLSGEGIAMVGQLSMGGKPVESQWWQTG